jgi:rubrerythrin
MPIKFNIDEVLEMACQIERNGAKFYRDASGIVPADQGAGLLQKLAAQEDEHLETFQGMRKELSEKEQEETAYDPYDEAALYLKAMADSNVFDSKELRGNETLDDIFRLALQAEKDSVAFYVGLKEMVPNTDGKAKMSAVIREEMRHIRWIIDEMKGSH